MVSAAVRAGLCLIVTASGSDLHCAADGSSQTCAQEQGPALGKEQALLQARVTAQVSKGGCTASGADPYASGTFVECCAGYKEILGQWDGSHHSYSCQPLVESCTKDGEDPWQTGDFVECCDGLNSQLGEWTEAVWGYKCTGSPAPPPAPPSPPASPAPPGGVSSTIIEWNVHWQNRHLDGIAGVLQDKRPDIIGICELTANVGDMAAALTRVFGHRFEVQGGRGGWVGYGTDIFFDAEKWQHVDGGVDRVHCASKGGPRAANWVVLRERASNIKVIVGGIHTSYCEHGCDGLHFCELGHMYNRFEAEKRKHGDAAVMWMGDLNRHTHSHVMQSLFRGDLGGRGTFAVDDMAKTQENTYFSGGRAIDHILGERGAFHARAGGRTGHGNTGSHLVGADHFPIFADVEILKR